VLAVAASTVQAHLVLSKSTSIRKIEKTHNHSREGIEHHITKRQLNHTTMRRQIVSYFFVFVFESSTAIKECIQPVRTRTQDPPCPYPLVPKTLNRDYDGKSSWWAEVRGAADGQSSKKRKPYNEYHLDSQQLREPCSLVAEAIYADLPVFDVVLLNNGMCNPSMNIERGVFGPEQARDFLPYNNELVGFLLHGKEIVHALEHGLSQSLDHGVSGAYPKTAGIRYDVTEEFVEGPIQGK
jgi:hypothetical protein